MNENIILDLGKTLCLHDRVGDNRRTLAHASLPERFAIFCFYYHGFGFQVLVWMRNCTSSAVGACGLCYELCFV